MSDPHDRLGVPLEQARLLRVEARLQQGAPVDPRWPLPLDGILATAARRRAHGDLYGGLRDPHVHDIPLTRWTHGVSKRWWWLASCATWHGDTEELHYWHRRIPHAAAEQATGTQLPPMIYEQHGRYRAYRVPLVVTVTPQLTWWCIGDPARVRDLLTDVWAVGKKHSQGEGAVLRWAVEDCGEPHLDRVHWRRDGHIARPIPARAATILGVTEPDTVPGAYRPPYWRPPPDPTATGTFQRQWQEVIAPWTQQPQTTASSTTSASQEDAA